MDIRINAKLKDVSDFQMEKQENFEDDIKDSLQVLFIRQGVQFEDFEIDYNYEEKE